MCGVVTPPWINSQATAAVAVAAALDGRGAPETLQVWVMMETPRAFLRC